VDILQGPLFMPSRTDIRVNESHQLGHKRGPLLLVAMVVNIRGVDVLIDDEDYPKIEHHKMSIHTTQLKVTGKYYFWINSPGGKHALLHRFLLNLDHYDGIHVVDHINGNTLDNRKSNLRICTQAGNVENQRISKRNKSGFKGANWSKGNSKWLARICWHNKVYYLGYYNTVEEAHAAYCEASKKYHGEYGRTR
jgi:hypothetical protein